MKRIIFTLALLSFVQSSSVVEARVLTFEEKTYITDFFKNPVNPVLVCFSKHEDHPSKTEKKGYYLQAYWVCSDSEKRLDARINPFIEQEKQKKEDERLLEEEAKKYGH